MKARDGSSLIPGPCLDMIKCSLLMAAVLDGLRRKGKDS